MDWDQLCLKCMRPGIVNGVCSHCGAMKGFAQEPIFALPPSRILHGSYMVGAVLGHGGFGITYMGLDMKSEQRVAIKEFLPDGLATRMPGTTAVSVHSNAKDFQYGLNQFLEEARTIYKYKDNPNIISVRALFEENNTAYYVMEYLDGSDLKCYLGQKGGMLSFDEAKRLLSPVFDALSDVHKQGLIHRDISPDNIYICKSGQVKLLDFGAARVSLIGKSKSLSIILKRGYAPEEQYRSRGQQGPWTDVYALGATLYKCLTSQLPPEATERLYRDDLIPPSRLCKELPIFAERAMLKALAVKSEERFQSAAEFKAAFIGQVPIAPHPTPPVQNKIAEPVNVVSNSNLNHPGRQAKGMEIGNIGKRIGAYLIDAVALYLITQIVLQIIPVGLSGYLLLMYCISVTYGSLCEASSMRGTIGKKLVGLQVSDAYGSKLDTGKVVIRNLIKFSPSFVYAFLTMYGGGIFAIVNYGWALFNKNRQALHDLAAGSFVISSKVVQRSPAQNNQMAYAPVQAAQPNRSSSANLTCTSGYFTGTQFPIQNSVIVGRNPKISNIVFPNDIRGVSGIHCELRFERNMNRMIITDKNSSHGTFVNGRRLSGEQSAVLQNGDSFTIGENNTFVVQIS